MKRTMNVLLILLFSIMLSKTIYDVVRKERFIKALDSNTSKTIELIDLLDKNNSLIEELSID